MSEHHIGRAKIIVNQTGRIVKQFLILTDMLIYCLDIFLEWCIQEFSVFEHFKQQCLVFQIYFAFIFEDFTERFL